jgi:peptide/nickel transport system substrate-binding protein
MISETAAIVREDAAYVPLHQQQIVWAARQGVEIVQTPDNYIQLHRGTRVPAR